MPRQSRGRSAAPRSAAPAQSRGAHTATAPAGYTPSHAPAPPASKSAAPEQPGMLAQMAATAGSVAIGSTIGHGLSSMLFGGGGSSTAGESSTAEARAPPIQQQTQTHQQQTGGISCDVQAKDFTLCLETADVKSCSWYLEQLKACQAAAAPY